MKSVATVAAVALTVGAAPAVAQSPSHGPDKLLRCVIRVFEDGSAVFRDAEEVRARPGCEKRVLRYVNRKPWERPGVPVREG